MTITDINVTDLGLRKVAGRIGAELDGVRLSGDLPDAVVAGIREALLAHKVIFFRGQGHLTDEEQVAFGRRLGTVTSAHPTVPAIDDNAFVLNLDSGFGGGRANNWHTDVTFVDRPPAFTVLHAVVIPPVGGDTIWANTVTAYESLPAELRDLADRLRIVHSNDYDYAAGDGRPERADAAYLERRKEFVSTVYETEHPAVRVHPETAEHSLVLGGFARSVLGFSPQASRDLIRLLQEHVTRPEQTVRWHWREGDLAIWDNRATQHYAIFDYGSAHRRGERVTVAGPVPVGVDGRPSVPIKGQASAYYAGEAN